MTRLAQYVSIAFATLGFALPAAAFEASDLEGQWYGSGMIFIDDAPILWDLLLLVDANGVPSGTSNRYLEDGAWQIEEIGEGADPLVLNVTTGRVNGSFLVGADTVDMAGFQMNSGADLMSGANATADAATQPSILTFVKRGSTYRDTDLGGTWWLSGFYEDFEAGSEAAGSIRGTLVIDSDAVIQSGSLAYAGQPSPVEIPAGTILELIGNGAIRVDFETAETVLSEALDDTTTAVGVDATSGFSVGDYIEVGEESMKIDAIPVGSMSFTVVRGQLGTAATSHLENATVSKVDPVLGGDLYWRLAGGKTLMIGNSVGWETDGRNRHRLFQWVKLETGALPTDLARSWRLAQFEDTLTASDASAANGELVIDETGTSVTGGSLVFNDATSMTVSGGGIDTTVDEAVFEIPNLGYEGTSDESDVEMALSPGKDVFFGVSSSTGDLSGLLVGVPEPAARLLGAASLLVIAALRRRPRPRG